MSEKIKLKAPADLPAEYISQGNHSIEVKPKGTVTVENRRFADWLVREMGFTEIADGEAAAAETAGGKK